jgi:hypothetical protein
MSLDISEWLHGLGLGQYEPAFHDNDIDGVLLLSLTAEDLRDLGVVSIGHRRRCGRGGKGDTIEPDSGRSDDGRGLSRIQPRAGARLHVLLHP